MSTTKMTITEKILARGAGKEKVVPGENVWVNVDVLMSHDVCGPGMIETFYTNFGTDAKVWDPNKVVLIFDHFIFTKDKLCHQNMDKVRAFAKKYGVKNFYDVGEGFDGNPKNLKGNYTGVCHSTLAEGGHCRPGEIMFGTDSHTCTAGAFGCFSSGIGDQDGGLILGMGKLWVRVPESMKFVVNGEMPDYLMSKDIILRIISDIGIGGATYKAMEFCGSTIDSLNVDERMTITNMAVEAGGKNGIMAANDKVVEYLKSRTGKEYTVFKSDEDAVYSSVREYDIAQIEPMVAKPHSPENGELAKNLSDVKIDRSYIGSCTGGKITDFIKAAQILKGRKVSVDTFIVPATVTVAKALDEIKVDGKTLKAIFQEAGCIGPVEAGCQACLGGPVDTVGRTSSDEVVISSTNRNFVGRMGSKQAPIYLASPMTCAASAINGYITDPREFLKR